MKHQYFGDVNDYRKYGLLRCLREVTNLPLGVLWLLTADDGSPDGKFRRYLREPGKWRHHDPELYDRLCGLLDPNQVRHVDLASVWALLPGASYFDHVFTDSAADRVGAMEAAVVALRHCPVIFLDPDNGIEVESVRCGSRGSCKYVYWHELAALFHRGHSLVVYQHYPRFARSAFEERIVQRLQSELGARHVAIFKTSHVCFFLALQPQHAGHLPAIASAVSSRWAGQITATSGAGRTRLVEGWNA